MTPAIKLLDKQGISYILHEFNHSSSGMAYGIEAAELLGVSGNQVFKTLVAKLVDTTRSFAIALVPVNKQLSVKQLAKSLKVKKAEMADPREAERITGYLQGGISPIGQKVRLPTVIDRSAWQYTNIFVSAGRRGLEVELPIADLARLTGAFGFDIAT